MCSKLVLATNIGQKVTLEYERSDMVAYDCMVCEFFASSDRLFGAMEADAGCQVFDPNFGILLPC